MNPRLIFSMLLSLALCACGEGEDPSAPPVDQSGRAIKSGRSIDTRLPYANKARGAVAVLPASGFGTGCTGVIVGPRHVLTAAHCYATVGDTVVFYYDSNPTPVTDRVVLERTPPGVNASVGDYTDDDGKFADIAVLMLEHRIPFFAAIIELPDGYPGNGVWAGQVGRGQHDGRTNPGNVLREIWTRTYSSHERDGHILVDDQNGNTGDSGGPLYMFNHDTQRYEVQGIMKGYTWEWAWRDKYASTQHHLAWIMDNIWYANEHRHYDDRFVNGRWLRTEVLGSDDPDLCVLRCDKDSQCVAATYRDRYCYMFSSVTNLVSWSGWRTFYSR